MKVFSLFAALSVLAIGAANQAGAQETKVRWFGHAAFSVTTPHGKVLLIDPWLTNPLNPEAKDGKDPLASVPKVDYPGLRWHYEKMPEEKHSTIYHPAALKAFRAVFKTAANK